MNYYLQTFGCQMNISDSERIMAVLSDLGWSATTNITEASLVIINSCSVRQKAEDKVVGLIRNIAKTRNSDLRIGITGCMVRKSGIRGQIDDKLFKSISGLDFVFRINDLLQLPKILAEMGVKTRDYNNNYRDYFGIQPQYSSSAQAFVPIMTGCNNFCTYCIVPYTRGREKCRSLPDIINEINNLKNVQEITLLGQNVNSYVLDEMSGKKYQDRRDQGKSDFVILLEEVSKISGINRIRYSSSHPKDFGDDLISAHARLPNLAKHVHLALQSGDDEVLKTMNRHYTGTEFKEKISRLRSKVPDIAVTTDIIVGFCGEKESQFQATMAMVRDIKFDTIYLAQYSTRLGTYAAKNLIDDVSIRDKQRRWHELNTLLQEIVFAKHQTYLGQIVEVLVEEEKKGKYWGKTGDWKTVVFPVGEQDLIGQIVSVKVEDAKTWILEGIYLP